MVRGRLNGNGMAQVWSYTSGAEIADCIPSFADSDRDAAFHRPAAADWLDAAAAIMTGRAACNSLFLRPATRHMTTPSAADCRARSVHPCSLLVPDINRR